MKQRIRSKLFTGQVICYSILFILWGACKPHVCQVTMNGQNLEIYLEQYSDSLFAICLKKNGIQHSTWQLNYPVYRFDYGDITGDGAPEIAVGVIKPTRFDPNPDKRLFLFRITTDFYIRPLWLGSRVAHPLIDFRIVRNGNTRLIRTIERELSGNYLTAQYRQRGFGLEFKNYMKREVTLGEAQKLLKR